MDSPGQRAKGIPVTTTTFNSPILTFEIPAGGIIYSGEHKDDSIVGVFKQNGGHTIQQVYWSLRKFTKTK